MSRHKLTLSVTILCLAAGLALACGSSHKIESVTIDPASADAQDYPDGKVPFVATGHYNSSPKSVTPLQADWGVQVYSFTNGTMVKLDGSISIDSNGYAQCGASASGTYTIAASVALPHSGPPPPCPLSLYNNVAACPSVIGTAQLTCP